MNNFETLQEDLRYTLDEQIERLIVEALYEIDPSVLEEGVSDWIKGKASKVKDKVNIIRDKAKEIGTILNKKIGLPLKKILTNKKFILIVTQLLAFGLTVAAISAFIYAFGVPGFFVGYFAATFAFSALEVINQNKKQKQWSKEWQRKNNQSKEEREEEYDKQSKAKNKASKNDEDVLNGKFRKALVKEMKKNPAFRAECNKAKTVEDYAELIKKYNIKAE